ncbi:hypothetical protein FRC03_008379 [Tulasnella sp. 419]|nr:hypothetical protein FRC03_008379 [Tulasnella sp. 419]
MVAKVRHARTGSSVDAVAVCVEGPDTPPTHRRRKLGPVLLGLIQFLVSSVSVLVARSLRVPRSIRRCIILSIVSLLRRIAYMLPDDQAPANDPSLLPVPTPVTGTASVTIPVPAAPTDNVQPEPSSMTSSPPSSSSRPSASVLPSELEKRYGKAIMVAGTRRSAGQKTKAVNNNTGLGKELD